jgi:hypothetical protein
MSERVTFCPTFSGEEKMFFLIVTSLIITVGKVYKSIDVGISGVLFNSIPKKQFKDI